MTREEFICLYAEASGLEAKYAKVGILDIDGGWECIALPCACSAADCKGWAMVSAAHALHHLQFNAPAELRAAYMAAVKDAGGE
jgi:hypothetical protein